MIQAGLERGNPTSEGVSWLRDSNPGPAVYKTAALPTELSQQKCLKISGTIDAASAVFNPRSENHLMHVLLTVRNAVEAGIKCTSFVTQ